MKTDATLDPALSDLTRPRSAWQIDLRPAAPGVLDAVLSAVPELRPAGSGLELSGDVPALNRAIDALRGKGIEITSVLPRRDSLEDVFVRVLEEGEPQ